jgi:hypothetical protein
MSNTVPNAFVVSSKRPLLKVVHGHLFQISWCACSEISEVTFLVRYSYHLSDTPG